jgi:hypothetical protein
MRLKQLWGDHWGSNLSSLNKYIYNYLNFNMAAIQPRKCSCVICHKETSQLGIQTHYKRAHTDSTLWENSNIALKTQKNDKISNYNNNPKLCEVCGTPHTYEQRNNVACSHPCAAILGNEKRSIAGWKMPDEVKKKISNKLRKPKFEDDIAGDYSKLYKCICKHCSTIFFKQSSYRTCDDCKKKLYRPIDNFRFKFNVYHYPDLFNLDELNSVGWYSQGGKSRKPYNPNGLARDHRVSASESLRNNYDHYYITHPINCELMSQRKNSSKHSKSSMTYEELIQKVNEYDMGCSTGLAPANILLHRQ